MKYLIIIFIHLIVSFANGQNVNIFKQIDSLVVMVDSISSTGTIDTIKGGLLKEGSTTSDIFILKQGREVQKISVFNKSKNYREKIVFQNNKPVFVQFVQADGATFTFYLVGESAYFKDIDKFNKGSANYWYSLVDSYLSLFKESIDK